jgi:NADP-dependent alcohol dehydrogenase
MKNFTFYNPTRILFGKGRISDLTREIPAGARVLITLGGGSALKNGALFEVREALRGFTFIEFSGIEPNPAYETLMKAVDLARNEKIDFLLAVGGGSVIDGTKFISAAIPFTGEPWDILEKRAKVAAALPFGVVLTLPATGSEMNNGAVISRNGGVDKLAFGNALLYPRFSVLDPTKTYTLPPKQTANGAIDADRRGAEGAEGTAELWRPRKSHVGGDDGAERADRRGRSHRLGDAYAWSRDHGASWTGPRRDARDRSSGHAPYPSGRKT